MTLYDLEQDILELKAKFESGEIDEQAFADTLESLPTDQKLEGFAKLIRTWEAEAEAFTAESQRFANKATVAKNGIARLKARVQSFLVSTEQTEASAGLFKFRIVSNGGKPPLQFFDNAPDPSKADPKLTSLRYSFNNDAIREYLESGNELPWAKIGDRGTHVRIL